MTPPDRADRTAPPDRVHLLRDVGACLGVWHRVATRGIGPADPPLAALTGLSRDLMSRLPAVGFGGIAYHLGELMRRFEAGGATGDVREPLEALFHLAEQARLALTPEEQALLAPTGSGSEVRVEAPLAPPVVAPAPPPMMNASPAAMNAAVATPSHLRDSVPVASESGESKPSLLGLKRRAGSNSWSEPASNSPHLLHRPPSGLTPVPRDRQSSAPSERARLARNVRDLMSDIGRLPDPRRGNRARSHPAPLGRTQERRVRSRTAVIAAAIAVAVMGSLFGLVFVLMRRTGDVDRSRVLAASAASAKGPATRMSGELPRAQLLNDSESFRALIAQVHGRGKESTQLRTLLDEQAALAGRVLSSKKCEGPAAECQQWAKIRDSALGRSGIKRITRRRAARSPDRAPSRWMVGLTLPEIPVEDDPRVQRSFEYFTENPVGREMFQAMLFRCGAYRDLIQSMLVRYGLPADLFAIVFVESSCEPQAVSPMGATGLWQFMPDTGRAYHLRVTEGVDERFSPPKSTDAAIRFLRDLRDKLLVYNTQGVWDLALASYNLGPFAMVARIEQAGGDVGFWDLVDAQVLPDETAQYAPSIQAVALILNNLQRLKFAGNQMRMPQLTADLEVPAGTRLSLIARAASISLNQVRSLNLDIRGQTTPAVPNFVVQVPKDVVWQARETLKELMARNDDSDLCVPQEFDWGRQQFTKEMAQACQRKQRVKVKAEAKTQSEAAKLAAPSGSR